MKRIIISAANDGYYSLLCDLISSIEESRGASEVAVGILDIGLNPDQRASISARVQHVVTPSWDYEFSGVSTAPQQLRAMTARPHLPIHFPGYDVIMWMDADTWVQQWPAVEMYFEKAAIKGLAICQEIDRCYGNLYNFNNSRQLFLKSLKAFGESVYQHVGWMPIVNSGVFAMRADSNYWADWRDTLGSAIQSGHLDHFTEQTALNVCIYRRPSLPYFMPAKFNWLCIHSVPMFDDRTMLYVEPAVPHDTISIIHLAGVRTRTGLPCTVTDLQGNNTRLNLLYSQWKAWRTLREIAFGQKPINSSHQVQSSS